MKPAWTLLFGLTAWTVAAGAQTPAADRRVERTADGAVRRRALVIGNGAYANKPLKNPTNDAQAIATALGVRGFEVTVKTDLDYRRGPYRP